MKPGQKQQGTVLVVSLIVLLLVTVIGISGVRSGVLELQVASNEEQRVLALQTAQSALDAISAAADNFVVRDVPPETVMKCTDNQSCTDNSLGFDSPTLAPVDSAAVTRIAPVEGTPPRMAGHEFSASKFRSTFFRIEAEYRQAGDTHGNAKLVQGYMKLIVNGN